MSIKRKVDKICANADKAIETLYLTCHESSVWEDKEFGGQIFSWLVSRDSLIVQVQKEVTHVGFALTYQQIHDQHSQATVEYFQKMFAAEIDKNTNAKPEDELEKDTYVEDPTGQGFSRVTEDDLFGDPGNDNGKEKKK